MKELSQSPRLPDQKRKALKLVVKMIFVRYWVAHKTVHCNTSKSYFERNYRRYCVGFCSALSIVLRTANIKLTLRKCMSVPRFEVILKAHKEVTDWKVLFPRRLSSLLVVYNLCV